MATVKKFGTFGGVFTPSILTILGVIMYLRLPWIVGQAGLWITIGIIVVAHVISVTTGLSVASIATDKKVKVGGNYYIISRSMGLPIGGTLGIALFVGLSFSVSLYIIGFIESFLPTIGIEATVNNIRLYGTIAVLCVTAIVLISTSLAIKTQYFIMTAIVLSLISIFFGSSDHAPAAPVLQPFSGGEPLMVLFGIFFPAVTGFTAGVQMSGDLKDPKRSIPVGTIASIIVGFIVYIAFAIFFAYRVNADSLMNNPNILSDISWVPSFLFAGIWGATLSSAMGSLLGAPRILQATSLDRITPKVFAKGYGPGNEPRNALALTFLIAEVGILVGELNLIAAIISIFFITTYGFINLSCAIENWASPDFLPSFRIPTWVSVLGAASCFLVMIQLDLLSFIGSTLILGILYVYLKRKELTLESGDTWEGVWSSIIRSGLHRISKIVGHARNWRPNIILFSGGTDARPHLIEFGKWVVHKRGILSNFDLKENPEEKVLFSKSTQFLHNSEETVNGVFSRRLECRNIYEGMETISQVYGFSGLEPNTVLLGWARNSRNPQRFAQLARHFSDLDYNILMLDYDKERGFGKNRQIDIWWRGGNNNFTLSLVILKFLKASQEWQEAEARICILLDDSALINRAYKNMSRFLEEQRIDAAVKVINNAIEKRPFTDVVKIESANADLIVLGLPRVVEKSAPEFVERINAIVAELGSTLLVNASSFFEPLYVGIEMKSSKQTADSSAQAAEITTALPALKLPNAPSEGDNLHEMLAYTLEKINGDVEKALGEYHHSGMQQICISNQSITGDLKRLVERNFSQLAKRLEEESHPRFRKAFARMESDIYFHFRHIIETYQQEMISSQKDSLELGIEQLSTGLNTALESSPEEMAVFFEAGDLEPGDSDTRRLRLMKWRKRIAQRFTKETIIIKHRFRRLLTYHLNVELQQAVCMQLESFGIFGFEWNSDLQKWFNQMPDTLGNLNKMMKNNTLTTAFVEAEKQKLLEGLDKIADSNQLHFRKDEARLYSDTRNIIQSLCNVVTAPDIQQRIHREYKTGKSAVSYKEKIAAVPERWANNLTLAANFTLMELSLIAFRHRVQVVIDRLNAANGLVIDNIAVKPLERLASALQSYHDSLQNAPTNNFQYNLPDFQPFDSQVVINDLVNDLHAAANDLPETIEIISESAYQQIETQQYDTVDIVTISLRRMVDFLLETDFVDPFQNKMQQVPLKIEKSIKVAADAIRLIKFNLAAAETPEEMEGVTLQEPLSNIIENSLERISSECKEAALLATELETYVQTSLAAVFEKTNPYMIARSAGNLGQYIRTQESRRVISGVESKGKHVKHYFSNMLVRLLYRGSEGVLWARRLSENQPVAGEIDSILTLVESVSPKPAVETALPFYYRQLFTGKQVIGKEYWVGREAEMKKAQIVLQRYRRGHPGALLILGEPDSGKTALSRNIAQTHFNSKTIFRLFAPDGGCIDPAEFKSLLEETLQSSGSFAEMFASLPADSVIVIHDLELWWERSSGGFMVIDEIIRLMNRFSGQCFFVVNANTHSFHFIDRLKPIRKNFLGVIHCEPFDAKNLQEAVLLRHRSSGMRFVLDGHPEDRLSDFALAKLFTKYFDYSAGNIGVALQAWIGHIETARSDELILQSPKRPILRPLESIESEWGAWFQQFILHKHLTPERLIRLFRKEEQEVEEKLAVFKRAGLINEQQGVLQLNPYIQPFIIQQLTEMGLL